MNSYVSQHFFERLFSLFENYYYEIRKLNSDWLSEIIIKKKKLIKKINWEFQVEYIFY